MDGVIVVKFAGETVTSGLSNDGSFQVFVPDKDAKPRAILFRHLGRMQLVPRWQDMSWSLKRITELQDVE